jgi:3-hydroxybutyryl-CoA dehydrogenase
MEASAKPSSIGIVGMGLMGRGIAQVAASAGIATTLCKATPGDPRAGLRAIERSLGRAVECGRMSAEARDAALGRLTCTGELEALAETEIVVESIAEDLGAKQDLFRTLEGHVGRQSILASNTSSLPLARLATALTSAERFLGLHFFSPVPAMKLVEVGTLASTSPEAVRRAESLVAALGKTAVLVPDGAGLIVNRLLVPFLLDAIRALELGLAPAASIDLAMKLGCGHPMGPLELADAIGLDVVLAMARSLGEAFGDARYTPPPLLLELVEAGRLGKKSGGGLCSWVRPARG